MLKMKTFTCLLVFCLCVVCSRVGVADEVEQLISLLEFTVAAEGKRVAIVLMNMTQDVFREGVGVNEQTAIFDAVVAQKRLMAKVASWPEEVRARIWVIDVRSNELKGLPFNFLQEEARSMQNYSFFRYTPRPLGNDEYDNYFMVDEPFTMTPSKDLPLRTYQKGDSLDLVVADTRLTLSEMIERNGLDHFFIMGQGAMSSVAQMTTKLIVNAKNTVYVALSYSITLRSIEGEELSAGAAKKAKRLALYGAWVELSTRFPNLKLIGGLEGYREAILSAVCQ